MALIVAAMVSACLCPVLARIAHRVDVLDRPGELKVQTQPVPYLGGVAIAIAVAGPVAVSRPELLIPLAMAVGVGLADDVTDLAVGLRLVVELMIGATVAAVLPGDPSLIGMLVAVVVTVVLINAVNLIDGLDGLAATVTAVGAIGFAVVLDGPDRTIALGLAGALIGFLLWNRPPARIYAGDAGSYLVGTALALLLCITATVEDDRSAIAGALLFVGVPVADTAVAILRRARAGKPLLMGDRGHVYDQLVDRGWSPGRATAVFAVGQAALVATGVATSLLPETTAIALAGVVIFTVAVSLFAAFTSPAKWTA